MKPIWNILNIGLLALGLWGGYRSTEPGSLTHANPDPMLWLVVLFIMPLHNADAPRYEGGQLPTHLIPTPDAERRRSAS
jgi:hypothetical protein